MMITLRSLSVRHSVNRGAFFCDGLLDGRNRIAACKIAEVEPSFTEYAGDDPVAFVVSVNIKRRQLDQSQRACIAVEIEGLRAIEAKKRMLKGVRDPEVNSPQGDRSPQARDEAATMVGVGGAMIHRACIAVEIEVLRAIEAKKRYAETVGRPSKQSEVNSPQIERAPQARDQAAAMVGVSVNIKRRQLDQSQRACIAVEIEGLRAIEAKKRQIRKPVNSVVVNSPQQNHGKSRDEAATMVGVGGQLVTRAKAIKKAETRKPLLRMVLRV